MSRASLARRTAGRVGRCNPEGALTPWVHGLRSWCRCGEELHHERTSPTINDWTMVDSQGRSHIDQAPEGLREDPKRWWAELFEASPQRYSTLRAAVDLGHHSWFHIHRAEVYAIGPVPLGPTCHGRPMRASPDGWECREMRTLYQYRGAL